VAGLTWAVKVTVWPTVRVVDEDVRVTVLARVPVGVGTELVTWRILAAEKLEWNLQLPRYLAVIVSVPAGKVVTLRVALALVFRVTECPRAAPLS
jgi:hypothetical protein